MSAIHLFILTDFKKNSKKIQLSIESILYFFVIFYDLIQMIRTNLIQW